MKYKKLVPEDSFIGLYMKYMSVVETADAYDFWCAMWAIGVGGGRAIYLDRPNSPVYLNWYIILAAESGTTRKSTAISNIRSIIDSPSILSGKTSPEALELILHEQTRINGSSEVSFCVPELVTILGREGYMATMPGLLTDLYDCPEYRNSPGTLKSGEIIQKNVFVTFLSASTPSWLVTAINPSVIEGGFTSRVMFVVSDDRKRAIAWPEHRGENDYEELCSKFQATIHEAKKIGGLTISQGGLRKFKKWYNNRSTHTDPFQSSFEAREDDHVLRAASCLAINDGILELQSNHITNGIKLVNKVKQQANGLFGGDFSQKARITGGIEKVRSILIEAGSDGIKHSKLYQRVRRHIDPKELELLMNILHESGMCQIFKNNRSTIYRATRSIEQFGVTTEVLSKLNLH